MFAQPEENKRQKEMRGTSIITLSEKDHYHADEDHDGGRGCDDDNEHDVGGGCGDVDDDGDDGDDCARVLSECSRKKCCCNLSPALMSPEA